MANPEQPNPITPPVKTTPVGPPTPRPPTGSSKVTTHPTISERVGNASRSTTSSNTRITRT